MAEEDGADAEQRPKDGDADGEGDALGDAEGEGGGQMESTQLRMETSFEQETETEVATRGGARDRASHSGPAAELGTVPAIADQRSRRLLFVLPHTLGCVCRPRRRPMTGC